MMLIFIIVFACILSIFARETFDPVFSPGLNEIESISNMTCYDNGEGNSCSEIQQVIPKGANPEGKPREASSLCEDRYDDCQIFAAQNECQKNPGWMIVNCASSCNACELRNPKIRCDRAFLNISSEPIYKPGSLEYVFERIEREFGSRYQIKVESRSPWVIVIDNFATEEEMDAILGTVKKWERSTDTGSMNEFGESGRILSNSRTSSNAWCREDCESNPLVQQTVAKIEEITMVPRSHYESYQILKYDVGQYYRVHHDSSQEDNKIPCGPRILTFFMYLSDVEEGGETSFPKLNIAVKPKRGRAVLWPSVLDHSPSELDGRTIHEAKAVIKGRKYAANAWIHLYDFAQSNLWGCTGAFDEM